MCDPDLDRAACQTLTWRRARKRHQCCACREGIRKGDRYHVWSGIWDGTPDTYKHCARCYAMLTALFRMPDVVTVQLDLACGELWSNVFGDIPDDVAALAFMTADDAQANALPDGVTA